VSSSTTGSLRTSAAVLDAANRWSVIGGHHSVGRFAVASTRTVASVDQAAVASNDKTKDKDARADGGLKTIAADGGGSDDEAVEEVADTGQLGVEMDLQIGQMTLRSKHLSALESKVANHCDVKLIFGDATMQASLLEKAEHRTRYKLASTVAARLTCLRRS